MPTELTLDLLKDQEGSLFTTRDESGETFDFKLIKAEISPYAKTPPKDNGKRTPFSILLQGPENVNFNQGTLNFSHSAFDGEVAIFVVAIESDSDQPNRLIYQAVFS